MTVDYADYPRPATRWSVGAFELTPAPAISHVDRLRVVTDEPKETVTSPHQVPAARMSTLAVPTSMRRPRSSEPHWVDHDWYPQLRAGHLLRLPHAFVGDNVVFDDSHYYSFGKWWLGSSWELYRGVREVRQVPAAVSIAAWGGEAFQHFVKDALPKLATVIDALEVPELADVRIVTHRRNCAVGEWLWDRLGLTSRVVQKPIDSNDGFVIGADAVYFVIFEPCLESYGLYPRHSLQPVQRRLGLLDPPQRDLVVYLRRTGPRSVANERDVLETIERVAGRLGYTTHVFSPDGDFDRDVAIMRRAVMVLGPHGGAFANIAFASPGTHVVEFLPIYDLYRRGQVEARRSYWGLSQAAGHDYWVLEPEDFDFDRPGMVVDPQRVEQLVQRLLA